jgi:hypothetical protein
MIKHITHTVTFIVFRLDKFKVIKEKQEKTYNSYFLH